jgi:hypothetical protein
MDAIQKTVGDQEYANLERIFTRHVQLLLKEEWERVKFEARGVFGRLWARCRAWHRRRSYKKFCADDGSVSQWVDRFWSQEVIPKGGIKHDSRRDTLPIYAHARAWLVIEMLICEYWLLQTACGHGDSRGRLTSTYSPNGTTRKFVSTGAALSPRLGHPLLSGARLPPRCDVHCGT